MTDQDHPRPQLRRAWTDLDGRWDFAYDDEDRGLGERWSDPGMGERFDRVINVPFAPESQASGVGDTGYHPVVWYRRAFRLGREANVRHLLHFGAVDHEARVWIDGRFVGSHEGGQTAFSFDITDALGDGEEHQVVVRAYDDPVDPEQARGKQDWQPVPHGIWYHRTTGIWRTVWLEQVSAQHVRDLEWECDLARCRVGLRLNLAKRVRPGTTVRVMLCFEEETVAEQEVTVPVSDSASVEVVLDLPMLRNAQAREKWLWTPENPVLLDVSIQIMDPSGSVDRVDSYHGLREVGVDSRGLLLNHRPYYLRGVLEQTYWETTHFTTPGAGGARHEVELIRQLGFNMARIHQTVADPRMLYWADRLGLLVWAEIGSAWGYSASAAASTMAEWGAAVRQQHNHPCVVVWVPVNESWGVQDLGRSQQQRSFVRAITEYTRALDGSRPVISNDGWEHLDSDILTVHDYTADPLAAWRSGRGAAGRVLFLDPEMRSRVEAGEVPMMVTEFGGISFEDGPDGSWGYSSAGSLEAFEVQLGALFEALREHPAVTGFCYTQLTDTRQESNGLAFADRRPKLPVEVIRRIVTGRAE